jgi:hypothetical protein
MTTPSENPPTPNGCLKQKNLDYGNAFVALMFVCLGYTSVSRGEWMQAASWLCLATGCAVMIGLPGIDGKNWKKPRSLAAITFCIVGVVLLICSPIHHHKPSTQPVPASLKNPSNQ